METQPRERGDGSGGDPEQSRYQVVVNDAGHVAAWPVATPPPAGWYAATWRQADDRPGGEGGAYRPAGADGQVAAGSWTECLAEIARRNPPLPGPRRQPAGDLAQSLDAPGTGGHLADLVAEVAARHGGRVAFSDEDRRLTYAEFDGHSSALAEALIARGIRPEDRVVVYRPRGIDVFVALLAILKAGAAYVLIDSRYEDARRDLMIEHSGAVLVITQPGWSQRLAPTRATVWEWDGAVPASTGPYRWPVRPDNAACVLFTSGSSGTPKAVVLQHDNLVAWARNPSLPGLLPDDRMAHISNLSFDAFHYETWPALAAGAEIVVMPSTSDLLALDVGRELRRRRITAMLAPTMAVNQLVREDREVFSTVRVLCTGGDVLATATCRDLLAGEFGGEFYNLYGPTEGTTACTGYRVRDLAAEAQTVPIGSALAGAAVYCLRPDLTRAPDGEPGELHIGGTGVARGYLNAADLTAAQFRPDPFGPPGSRMYATGDLARVGPDGQLEFLGRIDDQVKIRGYRVEPAEVERVLDTCPELREAVVAVSGEGDERHLVAVVVPHGSVTPGQVRQFAQQMLPDYMVPSSVIVVSGIPSTEHGKRDRARIADIIAQHRERQREYVAPANEVERYLAGLWESLLRVERVGTEDDFFDLGGHSLLAFRVQRRIRKDLGLLIDFPDLLAKSRLADLAGLIDSVRSGHE